MPGRPLFVAVSALVAVLGQLQPAFSSTSSSESRVPAGPGPDVYLGTEGFDTLDYSSRTCDVSVTIGDGLANDGCVGEGDNVTAAVEHIIGGSGADQLTGDGGADLLVGGPGADRLTGLGGDDELRGDEGNDLLIGGPNDDHLIGGPGNDDERGEGNNDAFSPAAHTHVQSSTSVAIADRSTTVATLAVSGLPSRIQDVNVRIDVEHPSTHQLSIVLISPAGTRDGLSRYRGNGTPMRGTVFDSEAVTNIRHAGSRPLEGRFHPDDSMEVFEGQNPNGTWRLEIVDGSNGGAGTLHMWELQFTFASSADDGNDVLSGGSGTRDIIDYAGRSQPVTVTMGGGADDGQSGEVDNLGAGGIEDCYGGTGGDRITGTVAANDLRGQTGNDTISGLNGPDQIRGRQGADTISGGDGNDTIQGGPNNDSIDGGAGTDVASYVGASGGVTVSLGTGTSSGAEGSDSLKSLENVSGSRFGDTLRGGATANSIVAGGGNDSIEGLGGDDRLDGQTGTDTANGGTGRDVCLSAETKTSCEG